MRTGSSRQSAVGVDDEPGGVNRLVIVVPAHPKENPSVFGVYDSRAMADEMAETLARDCDPAAADTIVLICCHKNGTVEVERTLRSC